MTGAVIFLFGYEAFMIKKILKFFKRKKNWGTLKKRILWIAGYAVKYWKEMIFYTVLGLSGTALSLVTSLISKDLVDIITGHQTGQVISTFIMMIGMTLGSTLITQISSYFSSKINLKVETTLKSEIFEKILDADWEQLSKYHTGDLLTRWGNDVNTLSNAILSYIPNCIVYFFRFGAAFAMMAYYDVTFALIAMVGMPFTYFISKNLTRRMQRNNMRSSVMNAKMSGFNQEAFSNIQTIKAFDMIDHYVKRLKSLQSEYVTMRLNYQKIYIIISILLTIVGLAVSYISYGWGIYRVWSGVITYGTMTMFISLSGTLTNSLNNLLSLIPSGIGITTSASRLMDLVNLEKEDLEDKDKVKEFYDKYGKNGVGIEINNVKYSYRNGNEIFDGASIVAKPHEIVALIGPSGEGKTTMLRLLLSLVRPKEGDAVIVGSDGQTVELSASVRQLISYVPQGNTMFSGTIAENMRNVKEDATDEEIIGALKMACAWDFVEKLPDGINSEIMERGGGFSEGQAQRLSIARAILRQSPILLLDEATSALDPETAKKLLRNIMVDIYPRTCVLTTHRPGMLRGCTRVYRISDKHCTELTQEEVQDIINS